MEKVICPICLIPREKHPPIAGRDCAVTFCPLCGIPHFMEQDRIPERVVCEICQKRFEPEKGGGFITGRLGPPFTTPRGVHYIILLGEKDYVNKHLDIEVFVNKHGSAETEVSCAETRADDTEIVG